MKRLVLIALATVVSGPVFAQNAGARSGSGLPGVSEPAPVVPSRKAPGTGRTEAARPCPEYGPGFVRLDGASTCVRASGQVRVDGRWHGSSADGVSSSARGRVSLDMRTPTGAGPVRVFVRGQGETAAR